MGGHNTQVFSATPVRITFECPVSVVLRGDTLEWISAPRGRPSAHARCDVQKICGLFGIVASQRATADGYTGITWARLYSGARYDDGDQRRQQESYKEISL